MMSHTHNEWVQRDIINNIIILTKQDADMIYTIIPTKHQNYPSTKILNHANVLAKVNKSPYERLLGMAPHDAYILTIHVLTMTLVYIIHKQKD